VSVAEVGYQDTWQRALVGVGLVAPDSGRLDAMISSIRRYVDELLEVEVCEVAVSYLEED
jgi:hypothetical protein